MSVQVVRGRLVSALRSVLFYKYFVLVALSVVLVVFLTYDPHNETFDLTNLGGNFLTAVLAGLLMTIIYDTFVKKEQQLLERENIESMAHSLSGEILGRYGISVIPEDQLESFMEDVVNDERCLHLLSLKVAKTPREASMIKNGLFHALWKEPMMQDVAISNRLFCSAEKGLYSWRYKKSFRITKEKNRIRFILTGENDIATKINPSIHECDNLICTSKSDDGIRGAVDKMELTFKYKAYRDGALHTGVLPASISVDGFSSIYPEWSENWANRVAIIDYDISEFDTDVEFELQYVTTNKLNDCFFYEVMDGPAFVNLIEIDYSSLKEEIGHVSVVSLMSSKASEMTVDKDFGYISLNANGHLLWSGQGVFMVWRGPGYVEKQKDHI